MLTPKQIETLTTMRNNGASYKLISEKLECSESTIFNYCKQMGLGKGVNPTIKDHVRSLNEISADQIIIPEKKDKNGNTVFERQPLMEFLEIVDSLLSENTADVSALQRELEDSENDENDDEGSIICPRCNHALYPLFICVNERKVVFPIEFSRKGKDDLSSNGRENAKKFVILSPKDFYKYGYTF